MPNLFIIAGPNGAGKSTVAPKLLRDRFGIVDYVNADTIAAGLSAFAPATVSMDAGRIMLHRLKELAGARKDFAFETTLASRFYAKWLSKLRATDYKVHLIFLWLNSPDLAIERVHERVRQGGHDIPTNTIRRRFDRGLVNLFDIYLPIVDSWQILNTSGTSPIEVAFGDRLNRVIVDEAIWQLIER